MDLFIFLAAYALIFGSILVITKLVRKVHQPTVLETESEVPKQAPKHSAPKPKMRDFESNSPKNESYFTYESLETEKIDPPTVSPDFHNSTVENLQQIPENEEQNNIKLNFDKEEIQKGIIYSIIFKKLDI